MVTKSCWYSRETAEYQLRLFRAINLFRASLAPPTLAILLIVRFGPTWYRWLYSNSENLWVPFRSRVCSDSGCFAKPPRANGTGGRCALLTRKSAFKYFWTSWLTIGLLFGFNPLRQVRCVVAVFAAKHAVAAAAADWMQVLVLRVRLFTHLGCVVGTPRASFTVTASGGLGPLGFSVQYCDHSVFSLPCLPTRLP